MANNPGVYDVTDDYGIAQELRRPKKRESVEDFFIGGRISLSHHDYTYSIVHLLLQANSL